MQIYELFFINHSCIVFEFVSCVFVVYSVEGRQMVLVWLSGVFVLIYVSFRDTSTLITYEKPML